LFLYLLQGATLGLSASATPGPFLAFLLSQTLRNGWRHTLPAALAPLISDGPIIALVMLVLTQTSDWLLSLLRVVGGLFILYLAWGAWRAFKTPGITSEIPKEATQQNLLKAALMNALSPGPYLFWSVLAGPIVLEGWRQSPVLGLGFVLGFYATLIGGFAVFVIIFATASQIGPKVSRILSGVSAAALLVFGLYQIWTGLSHLWLH
jgi:threonine/homoserine/homoserine lactone efflux protein